MKQPPQKRLLAGVILTLLCSAAEAAVSIDRTRVIFDGGQKSLSLNVTNNNKQLPYLAQGWIDDAQGQKVTSPLVVLPPVQRIEPGKSSQVKIEALPAISALPQDRESLFYFNLREIPPKSDKPNTLQIALQTRVKLFYRPKAIVPDKNGTPWQEKLTLLKQGEQVQVKNPTPYYVTIIGADGGVKVAKEFTPVMVAPFSDAALGVSANALGSSPTVTYINDYGGRPNLKFTCQSTTCQVAAK
ncbi:fimbria/pilus periplasmic chaperone [Providencia rettgeri]